MRFPLPQIPPIGRPEPSLGVATANCIVALQICSSNQLGLTRGACLTTGMIKILPAAPPATRDRDESSITTKPEIRRHCYLPRVPVAPLFAAALVCPPVSSLGDAVTRSDCSRQKGKGCFSLTGGGGGGGRSAFSSICHRGARPPSSPELKKIK